MATQNEIGNLILINFELLEGNENNRELICKKLTEYRNDNPNKIIGFYSLNYNIRNLRKKINEYFTKDNKDCYGDKKSPFLLIPKTIQQSSIQNISNFGIRIPESVSYGDLKKNNVLEKVNEITGISTDNITIIKNKNEFYSVFNIPTRENTHETTRTAIQLYPKSMTFETKNYKNCKNLFPIETNYFVKRKDEDMFDVIVSTDPLQGKSTYKEWELVKKEKITTRTILSDGKYHFRFKKSDYSTGGEFKELTKKICSRFNNSRKKGKTAKNKGNGSKGSRRSTIRRKRQ